MSMKLMVEAMNCKVGNPLRKLVLIKLADQANDRGECWPSYRHIAEQCEISRRSVIAHIRELQKMGFVEIRRRRKGDASSSNIFVIKISEHRNGGAGAAPGVVQEIHQGGAGAAPGVVQELHPESINIESINEPSNASPPYQDFVSLYHECLPELPRVQLLTEKRKKAIKARWNTSEKTKSLDWWREYFLLCKSNPFLMGDNSRGWRADFDFLMTESKFARIVEGSYNYGVATG